MVISRTDFPSADEVLPGRDDAMKVSGTHAVNQASTVDPFPPGSQLALFGMGCFWGAEKLFWEQPGVISTQVGYSGGITPNPTYQEVCTGLTGHAEVVRVVFDPTLTSYATLLDLFWTNHDPTQGMKQDIDVGTQYRSAIYYYTEEQRELATSSIKQLQQVFDQTGSSQIAETGSSQITTEIKPVEKFYYAEDYHQQYLHKNDGSSCSKQAGGACARPAHHTAVSH